ncbi:MAG: hypothetical protein A2293_12155 [Elusimicrobia bacterium RIFOXYB2_FULL_49_7]|nr:MAG: hypothetical protein A2293_12155 [Elusimicrobia bacterium RIFOXYB2_FULL_49_7]
MGSAQQSTGKVKISFKQAVRLLIPYTKKRILEQVRAVTVIVLSLLGFQLLVLRIPIAQAGVIALGIGLVISGLAFYMEGLFLGIMPLGEANGIKLPQKTKLPTILIFSFILGIGVTLAEPAIGVLQAAGFSVKAWNAPLLFLFLNRLSSVLVIAVAIGVGLAVITGMIRFMYNLSLKPFLFVLCPLLLLVSTWAAFNPNLIYLTGVAWDCGGVTTGPVTVPLVLALGIGICRVVGSAGSSIAGFGVVSLASLFPIVTVLFSGILYLDKVPDPMPEKSFFAVENREKATYLFGGEEGIRGYAFKNASYEGQLALFDNDTSKMIAFLTACAKSDSLAKKTFGATSGALQTWALELGTAEQRLAVFGDQTVLKQAMSDYTVNRGKFSLDIKDLSKRNTLASLRAVIPLCLFLMLVLLVILRERIPRADETFIGILFACIGMSLFNCGIELGLTNIGNQVGSKVPSSFKAIPLPENQHTIQGFDRSIVQTAISPSGEKETFFFTKIDNEYQSLPFMAAGYDSLMQQYTYIPTKGPLFGGKEYSMLGILVVLLFTFAIGYGATIAEPALNALGSTVEELTVGTFKKAFLIQSVAVGVGIGLVLGMCKIMWNIPLIWLLLPSYAVTLFLTIRSGEEYVNIGWDSGGVTTGPITVPLVLAMGLGVGGQLGVVEGFGILAMASIWPILSVLLVGQIVSHRQKAAAEQQTALEGA